MAAIWEFLGVLLLRHARTFDMVGLKKTSGCSTWHVGAAMSHQLCTRAVQVWAGATHFPDFFLPRARAYFTRLLKEHHGLVPWDGIWVRLLVP